GGGSDGAGRAEVAHERLLALGADTGDVVEDGAKCALAAHLAVVGDGKAMRFVAYALEQVETLGATRQYQRLRLRDEIDLFVGADAAVVLLGDADHRDPDL